MRGGRVGSALAHGAARAGGSSPGSDDEVEAEDQLCVDDHPLVMVLISKRPTAVVVEVAGLKAPGGASARDYGLALEQLRDPRSLLAVRPLLSSAIGDELGFSGESSGEQFGISEPFSEERQRR